MSESAPVPRVCPGETTHGPVVEPTAGPRGRQCAGRRRAGPLAGTPPYGTIAVTSTFTAANGDRLYTTGVVRGSAIGPDGSLTVTGTYTAAGGTGRFAGARGTAAFAETARIDPARGPTVGAYTLEGRLAY